MGNLIPTERIYEGDLLSRPLAGLIEFRAQVTGLIRSFRLWGAVAVGSHYFNVRKSGASLFAGEDRLVLTSAGLVEKTSLAIPVTRGDLVSLDYEVPGSGSVAAPVVLLMETEE